MNQQNPGDPFAAKLREAEDARRASPVAMEFAGFPCEVITAPAALFLKSRRMPDFLTRMVVEVEEKFSAGEGDPNPRPRALTSAEMIEGENFQRHAICSVMHRPRVIAEGTPAEGEYLYADLAEKAPAFVREVFAWIMRGCPLPQEEGGEALNTDDLARFPDGARRGARPKSGPASTKRGKKAVGVNAADTNRVDAD